MFDQFAGSPESSPLRPQSRLRRFALWLAVVVIMYAAVELVLFTAISLRFGRVFTFSTFEARRRDVNPGEDPFGLGDVPARLRIRKEVIHPYLGYVFDPSVERSSPYGISDVSPIQRKSANTVVIGIFGGSFADDIAYHNEEGGLVDRLKRHFPGREIVVVKGTIGGYKQPQQLMALNYFTALGGEFDIVINLDGFNEVALPGHENVPNTNPFFPRQWHLRMQMVPDTEFLSTVGKVMFLDQMASKWADLFYTRPIRYSVTANTIWRIGDQLLYRAAVANRERLPGMAVTNAYAAAGPPATIATDDGLYAALGSMWAESSYLMHSLAQSKGIRYFHFLQPNQYLDGTKPMGTEERRIAIREDHPYAKAVKSGYPVLKTLGQELTGRGVTFVNLTDLYANTRDIIYRDNCCHVNAVGRRMVIEAIEKAIAADLARRTKD
jgi:hypothetical protein